MERKTERKLNADARRAAICAARTGKSRDEYAYLRKTRQMQRAVLALLNEDGSK